jgi:two-component system, NarL family, sensor histidine kinase DesK
MRLLPKDPDTGWTPYAWLIYAVPFALWPAGRTSTPADWALNCAGLAIFLGLYFWVHWLKGLGILWPVAGLALLGVFYLPWNPFSICFFIYAGAFTGYTARTNLVALNSCLLVAVLGLEGWLLRLPMFQILPGLVFIPLLAFLLLHYARRDEVNAKLLQAQEEVQHLARVAERERISRDLHDLLGHTLSVIVLKSELAARLASTNPERATTEIVEVEKIARQALAEVRSAVQGFRSTGLKGEFERARALLENAGLRVDANCSLEGLAPIEESVLTLALREGITNILRHSGASACTLRAALMNGLAELSIADNGSGNAAEEGTGLRGMRERIEALGGHFERHSKQGTQLRIRLPLGGAA